ncbi:hypothetical protein [Parasitella parasitica]|uniref:Glutathione transferase n=1 Tax=Parasitella parasitica TaxID=35722 RepID=A0A0B7NDR1_9FUNG|nr:hypothetical protein [Parasitella parasitica]
MLETSSTFGRGENVKLMLVDAGLDHSYDRITRDEWPLFKEKLQQEGAHSSTLPYIEINGQKFYKSVAIMRYISTKLDGKYHGSTPEENQLLDVVAELNDVWFEKMKSAFYGSEELKEEYATKTISAQIEMFEKYYSDRKEGPYLLGKELTYPDFLIYHMIDDNKLSKRLTPNLTKFVDAFEARPNMNKYFKSFSV